MRIAIVADIHGNMIAFEAVLAEITREQPDQVVCLGDVAATGPQPVAVLDRLRALGWAMVMGNTDAWLLDPIPVDSGADPDTLRFDAIDRWCAAQLTAADRAFIRTFQSRITIALSAACDLLCYHGSPRSFDDHILATTPDDALMPMLAGYSMALFAGGHTHVPMLRRHNTSLLINPGSVGMPFEQLQATFVRNPPWAEYAIIEWSRGCANVAFRRVPVEVDAVVSAALRSGMPYAEWWTQGWSSS